MRDAMDVAAIRDLSPANEWLPRWGGSYTRERVCDQICEAWGEKAGVDYGSDLAAGGQM